MQRDETLEAVDRLFPYFLYHGRLNETENGNAEPRRSIHRLPILPDKRALVRHSTSTEHYYYLCTTTHTVIKELNCSEVYTIVLNVLLILERVQ